MDAAGTSEIAEALGLPIDTPQSKLIEIGIVEALAVTIRILRLKEIQMKAQMTLAGHLTEDGQPTHIKPPATPPAQT